MLRTPHFYLLYSMALMMGIGGLMVTAQVAPMADKFKIGAAALTLSLTLNPLGNGGSRDFLGLGFRSHGPRANHGGRVFPAVSVSVEVS